MNIASVYGSVHQLATNHQMIKAIDEIRGGTKWRSKGIFEVSEGSGRKFLKDLISLSAVVERGKGDRLIEAAMFAGAQGASVAYGKLLGGEMEVGNAGFTVSAEMEVIDMTVGEDQVDRIIEEMMALAEVDGIESTYYYTREVPKALTYLG